MSSPIVNRPVTVAIVGAGHRSIVYADYARNHPDLMTVVVVADPMAARREAAARRYGIPASGQFASFDELARRPGLSDAVINGTMDRLHYASSMPLLEAGFHMLLEKPIAPTEREVRDLIAAAKRRDRIVMICHVLRYAPFYAKVKELLTGGAIGNLVALRTMEAVSYHHMAVGFVRGRWSRTADSNPMLLSKCCHDLDIIAWLMTGVPAVRVASFGSLMQFRPENAPPGAGERCLADCPLEPTCQYSAKLNYIDKNLWRFYAWECLEPNMTPTVEQKLESLRTNNPFGRCVWRCDNDVVDHQSVIVEFANGATATHDMWGAVSRAARTIHVIGSAGELEGDGEEGVIRVRRPSLARTPKAAEFDVETINLNDLGTTVTDGHGGGDERLIADFVATLRGESASQAVTRIEDSFTGHQIAFAADTAMHQRKVVELA
ncbi:MAG: Gfo/Idh/MocA family oxidoreductase [Phycisphaerae bacterium]|nr:Gfo/Idh/MocA family oxidoreductase [Phycisphaerae bacterium]